MAVDGTTFAYALKALTKPARVMNLIYKNHPMYALIPKREDFTGKTWDIPTIYQNTPGASRLFATAQALKANHAGATFLLTRVRDYAVGSISNETMDASENDEGAFVQALDTELKSCYSVFGNRMANALYRNTGGAIGRRSSISSNTVTLTNISDIVNFEVGMSIQAASTDGTSGSLRAGTSPTVSAVDRTLGTVTLSDQSLITAFADNDYLFAKGDFGVGMAGVMAWVPPSAPSSAAFYGVDRSVDTVRLGGIRVDISTYSAWEGFCKAHMLAWREGAEVDYWFCNPDHYANVENELGSKVHYVDIKNDVGIGFNGIKVTGGGGKPATLLPDPWCPYGYSFGLQMDTWLMRSLKKAPRLLGKEEFHGMPPEATSDAMEIRVGGYFNLGCYGPGKNCIATMPT